MPGEFTSDDKQRWDRAERKSIFWDVDGGRADPAPPIPTVRELMGGLARILDRTGDVVAATKRRAAQLRGNFDTKTQEFCDLAVSRRDVARALAEDAHWRAQVEYWRKQPPGSAVCHDLPSIRVTSVAPAPPIVRDNRMPREPGEEG